MQFAVIDEIVPNKILQVRMRLRGPMPYAVARKNVHFVRISWDPSQFANDARVLIHSASMRYRTAHIHHTLFDESALDSGLADSTVFIETPLDPYEHRNPRQDREAQRRLLQHLNEHIEYYHKAIWWSMDPDRRFMRWTVTTRPTAHHRAAWRRSSRIDWSVLSATRW